MQVAADTPETTDPERRPPGRPRSARADEAIISAVLDLLAGGTPVDALSIEAVAARAGVGKATIYRRWQCKEALVVDAVATLKPAMPQLTGASVRDDLVSLVRVAGSVRGCAGDGVLTCLVPQLLRSGDFYELYQRMVEPRRQAMRDVLAAGIRGGELRPDLDVEIVVAVLTAPVVLQKLVRWNPGLDPAEMPERIVDTVLAGVAAGPG